MEELTMAPKTNPDLFDEDTGNGDTPARCYIHQAKLAILEHRANSLEEAVHVITERTEPLSVMCQHVEDLTVQVQSFLVQYQEHTAEEKETAAKLARERLVNAEVETQEKLKVAEIEAKEKLELVATTTKLKTKTDVLWYIVIVIMLGAILAKLILPVILGA